MATEATHSQITTPNLHVEAADGVTYRYRRFGRPNASGLPVVCLVHFRANLDNWDPELVDALASEREVILVDLAGVGGSTGTTPNTVEEMAHNAIAFLDAIELRRFDLLGFSLGGFIAQEITLFRPWQVRRLVLAGTAPRGGRDIHQYTAGAIREAAFDDAPSAANLLTLFFEKSASSQAKGVEFLKRLGLRTAERDTATDLAVRDAQLTAISAWGVRDDSRLQRLESIQQPVLVANGDNDEMVPTKNTYLLAEHLPNAKLSIYPDAGHGFLFQYPAEFAAEVNAFLGR
ncbi:alpha/beta fold hydrolase [Streptomyces olivaceoviridis]|uniref:alpha/beta fold hydrolase n=1 Tax=Streptomyces olivaceoviridis TaxID=1921 RepID=UPI00024BCBFD|nr:hydrolase, alpha/beta hydrolase fold family [Streptomyces hygroscopicus subsp. jinggangensis 5008]AGF60277.1 hydrolase, alpha/beta hydrolase fold family [Streptomyces hygroscopicus subsp. jinggangensis TL01]